MNAAEGRIPARDWWMQELSRCLSTPAAKGAPQAAGARHARGEVSDLRVLQGRIQARVESVATGWAFFPHVRVRPWTSSQWDTAVRTWSAEPAVAEALRAGRLPVAAAETLAAHQLELLPEHFTPGCTCGARQPCEHVGVLLQRAISALAEAPADLLLLRGRPLHTSQTLLRAATAGSAAIARPTPPIAGPPVDMTAFWQIPSSPPIPAGEPSTLQIEVDGPDETDADLARELVRLHGLIRKSAERLASRTPPPAGTGPRARPEVRRPSEPQHGAGT